MVWTGSNRHSFRVSDLEYTTTLLLRNMITMHRRMMWIVSKIGTPKYNPNLYRLCLTWKLHCVRPSISCASQPHQKRLILTTAALGNKRPKEIGVGVRSLRPRENQITFIHNLPTLRLPDLARQERAKKATSNTRLMQARKERSIATKPRHWTLAWAFGQYFGPGIWSA